MNKMNKVNYTKNLNITKFTPLNEILEFGNRCNKSGHCCSFGGGFVLKNEIEDIAKKLGIEKKDLIENYLDKKISFNTEHYKLKSKKNKNNLKILSKKSKKIQLPFGPCVFLDENKLCKIHEHKPLHCKIGTCCKNVGEEVSLWFTLNYFVNPDDAESIRQWAIYLKTHPTIPGGELNEIVHDKDKLNKILNYEISK
ncbi:MAG: YkgJ family cysteine cluster protein [Candidatus Woesearchaeota archaeon]